MTDDYQAHVAEAAKDCLNCRACSDFPCAACLAGGICDRDTCHCDDAYDDWRERNLFDDYDDEDDET